VGNTAIQDPWVYGLHVQEGLSEASRKPWQVPISLYRYSWE
jgi:hypothetical protein